MVIIALTLLLLFLSFGRVFSGEVLEQAEANLTLAKYKSAILKISKLEDAYQAGIFNNQLFINLRSVFRLPLETGAVGKDNPFLLPLPPEVKKPGS